MDRSRESRRSSMATTNGFPRRRHRTSGLRYSSEEEQLELQETLRLREVASKRDRDRDSSNRNKRRRGSHREEGEQSTEESVGNEEDYEVEDAGVSRMRSPNTASSASDQNHRSSFPPARPGKLTQPPWKVTDEVIGVTVPRKARSVSAKRSHDSWVSASGGAEEQNFRQRSTSPGRQGVEAASPLSSNCSVQKKMKAIGPNTRLPKASKSSSSTQEEIEIEIAELLYGLKTYKGQESSQKLKTNDARGITGDSKTSVSSPIRNPQTSVPRGIDPSSYPFSEVENKGVEDFSSSTLVLNNSTVESLKNKSEQPAQVEILSPESAKISGFNDVNSTGRETGSSEAPVDDIKEDKLNASAGCGMTGDLPSCSKLDVDKEDSAATKANFAVPEANSKQVEKFEIDLMAPPPMLLSPERDDLSKVDFTSETKALALDMELKRNNNIKVEDEVERVVKKEKAAEEIQEMKIDTFKEKRDLLKVDLEKPNKDNGNATSNELEEKDRNQEQPPKLTNFKVERIAQSSSVPLSTGWPSSLPPLGCMPPSQTIVKTDKYTGSSTAQQHVNFVLSQPQPHRCATHHYIARNIFLHQQFIKTNPFWQAAVGSTPVCDTKSNNVKATSMPSTESMVDGKQSQQKLPGAKQNATQEKVGAAASFPGLAANKSTNAASSLDATQRKQLVLQQGPHLASAGTLVPGPAFLFPLDQHQTSVTVATSQAGGANSTGSASSSSKSHTSAVGSLGTSSALPAVAAAMSFSYPNLAASEAPYVTILQNSGYQFPFSTPLGGTAAIRGASPAQATHILNAPFYSSQMFHTLQHPQQPPQSQALLQPSYLNTGTPKGQSSSHKQPHGPQVNGNNILTSTNMQLQQQSQKQHSSMSHSRKLEVEMGGENVPSVASRISYSQKNVYGQNFTIPVQPVNFSFKPSATSDSFGGNSGNFGDKQQPQQAKKGGVELVPSQAFAISFAPLNGSTVPSNLNFSSMAQNPVIIHSLPDIAWQGYQAAGTAHMQKTYSMTEGKGGGSSTHQDDEKKAISGKSSTNGPTTLVFDNSSKNLNFMLSPMHGNWPSHSIAATSLTTNAPLSNNASSSQGPAQLLQLQKQHGMQLQQPPMAAQYKQSSTNTTSATKFVNNVPVFSQTLAQCNSSNQTSQSNSSGRTSDSEVHHIPIKSTAPPLKNFSHEQGRVLQDHMQISFGGNYKSSLPAQGQQLLNNSQPLCTTVAGSAPNGNLKPISQGSKVGSSINTLQMQQTENSSAATSQKSSPVCGRNLPSILSSCPSHLSELKY